MCSPEPFNESKTTQNCQSDTVSPPKLEFFTTLAASKRIFIVSIVFSMKFSTRNSVLTLKKWSQTVSRTTLRSKNDNFPHKTQLSPHSSLSFSEILHSNCTKSSWNDRFHHYLSGGSQKVSEKSIKFVLLGYF